jgi:adenosylhomocysteine nucleosidase
VRAVIFSAFPQEIRQIIKNLKAERSFQRHPFTSFSAKYFSKEIIVVLTGIGRENVEKAVKYIVKEYSPDFALSIGFGGALYGGAVVGEIVWGSRVFLIQEDIIETLELSHARDTIGGLPRNLAIREGSILTLEKWMKKTDIKKILPDEFSLSVCDMETFFLAKCVMEKGLPFLAMRSVTDLVDEEIPQEFLSVTDEHGGYRLSRALKLILGKPRLMKDIVKIRRNSRIASNNLWCVVRSLIEIL